MTEGLAIEIAKQKMQQLGNGKEYLFHLRHLQISPLTQVKLKAQNELFILIKPPDDVKVYSKAGIYNMMDTDINEMQYVHRGLTTVFNQHKQDHLHVKFLQVTPKIK